MTLQRLVDTNFLYMVKNPNHSWESAFTIGAVSVISLGLYVFWTKKNALLNFRAWALLTFLINLILFFHYCPLGPHIIKNNVEYQLTPTVIRLLMFLQFLTSTVTIWRLWQLSEKYIPRHLIYKIRKGNPKTKSIKKQCILRGLALWHTLKNGGNYDKRTKNITKKIEKAVKNI